MLAKSTVSGRNNTYQLDPVKIGQLKDTEGVNISAAEFEGTWAKSCQLFRKKSLMSSMKYECREAHTFQSTDAIW